MPARTNRIGLWLGAYGSERRGAAGVEFAVVLALLLIPILNVIDFGVYLFQNMEVAAATDAAAQAALSTCGWTNELPAYGVNGYCPSLTTAVTTAAQSTSLGTGVTVSFPNNPEGY